MGRRCGTDPCQLCAAAEDGPTRCGAYSEAADGEPVSTVVDAERGAAGPAPVADSPAQAGGDPDADQERIAASGFEPRRAEGFPFMERSGEGLYRKTPPVRLDCAATRR